MRLQFGHGVGAVENFVRNTIGADVKVLQFGHGVGAVENSVVKPGLPAPSVARFNSATALEPWRTEKSIREMESSFNRFNSATALEPWRTQDNAFKDDPRKYWLQFGHGVGAVENEGGC